MKTGKKIGLSILLLFIFLICGASVYFFNQIKPVTVSEDCQEIRFEVAYGSSPMMIANNLEKENIIKNATLFYYSTRSPKILQILYPAENIESTISLKSGIYHLKPNMNYAQLINILSSGQQEYIKVVIPEGLTITQIGEILEENDICSMMDFKSSCYSPRMIDKYNIYGTSTEGYIFPDTYYLSSGMTADSVLEIMIDNFFLKISDIPGLNEKSPKELQDIVILASIVEREYRVEDEAPLIASVFTNRLSKGIGLYSCATIVYIITEILGRPHPNRVLIEDTKIDNPYNTYMWAGLTPGPISNPGLVSLKAAANPPKTNYYFFQIVDADEGRHVFTSTFDEHKASHNLSTKN